MPTEKFKQAIQSFDQANSADPNQEIWEGKTYPKELLYAERMTERLAIFEPDASAALQLAARCQHICRWEIPRKDYPMDKKGYHQWRNDLKQFHADKSALILKKLGYDESTIEQVKFLVTKKQLRKNEATQTLEDVICLVFLQYYFEDFAAKHTDEKVIDILQKTWRKMSEKGHQAALQLPLSNHTKELVGKAL